MAVNVRPRCLIEAFAADHDGAADALVVNLLGRKLAAPTRFLSYTCQNIACGLDELAAARVAPRGIRVNGSRGADVTIGGQNEEISPKQTANPIAGMSPTDAIAR